MSNTTYRVGFIGVGRPWKTEGSTGFGMAYQHADGYVKAGGCEIVACADISADNATAFAEKYGFKNTYTDYEKMLAEEKLDFVSICTWPHLHRPMTVAAARAGVKAIHCEKPMAPTWGDAVEMARVCEEHGVRLTFNHQRRTLPVFQKAHALLKEGAIGTLQRIEANCADMYDWGTHWLDMFFFYNEETPVEWVIGQIDSRREHKVFGVPLENQGLCQFKFTNGVHAVLETGGASHQPVAQRLIGWDGIIEVHWGKPCVRLMNASAKGWQTIETDGDLHGPDSVTGAIVEIVHTLRTGSESILSAKNALRATEVIFATYESSRRRARVDLPLTEMDNAFIAMLEAGQVGPR
jgi:predicted dehydrogenase